ncbi:hypothetical protein HMPREF9997_00574 [Corynebacterium durum F0235]|uniref:Uncharacterized protein n=1 Tax=Corynebacterium durum F0235 TaxID=1035195 RepID=L1MKL6_9CORY|nr:hypothetical protein HMPREF9997_00574 [Corynebacterium durum F0235]
MATVTLDHTRIHRRDIMGSTSLKPTTMTAAISGNFQFSIVYWHQPDSRPRNH